MLSDIYKSSQRNCIIVVTLLYKFRWGSLDCTIVHHVLYSQPHSKLLFPRNLNLKDWVKYLKNAHSLHNMVTHLNETISAANFFSNTNTNTISHISHILLTFSRSSHFFASLFFSHIVPHFFIYLTLRTFIVLNCYLLVSAFGIIFHTWLLYC